MRRTFILIFLVSISLLNANFLIDVYHKDYGVIDRTVLVFDTKPNYEILKHESDLQINLHGCRKDVSLKKIGINNSKVITGLDYLISEDQVMVMININTSQLLVTGEIYKVDGMELQGDVFKLVLDIFISTDPHTLSELTSYASFYEKTGDIKLANEYNNKVLALHNEIKSQKKTTNTKTTQTITNKKSVKVTEKIKSLVKDISSKLNLKIVGFALGTLILLIVVIFLIIKLLRKKTSAFDLDDNSIRPTDGFADSAYLEKIAKDLAARNWEIDQIAKELELPLEKVQRIIAPDLEQELEHL
ncbi:MAG: hypothetical protein U9P73_05695 [Candidatus Cloacimonadota bacterium]|nr:hypothetical protein [Candidatus Cloacimonadota bacterium]